MAASGTMRNPTLDELKSRLSQLRTLAPFFSEGAISSTQYQRMSERQRREYHEAVLERYRVEDGIAELSKTDEEREREKRQKRVRYIEGRLSQLNRHLDDMDTIYVQPRLRAGKKPTPTQLADIERTQSEKELLESELDGLRSVRNPRHRPGPFSQSKEFLKGLQGGLFDAAGKVTGPVIEGLDEVVGSVVNPQWFLDVSKELSTTPPDADGMVKGPFVRVSSGVPLEILQTSGTGSRRSPKRVLVKADYFGALRWGWVDRDQITKENRWAEENPSLRKRLQRLLGTGTTAWATYKTTSDKVEAHRIAGELEGHGLKYVRVREEGGGYLGRGRKTYRVEVLKEGIKKLAREEAEAKRARAGGARGAGVKASGYPAEYDDIAKSLGYANYGGLSSSQKETVRKVAAKTSVNPAFNPDHGIEFVLGIRGSGSSRVSEVQSVLFNKEQWTEAEAKKWLGDHGFKHGGVDKGGGRAGWLRFRQEDPGKYGKFRTIGAGARGNPANPRYAVRAFSADPHKKVGDRPFLWSEGTWHFDSKASADRYFRELVNEGYIVVMSGPDGLEDNHGITHAHAVKVMESPVRQNPTAPTTFSLPHSSHAASDGWIFTIMQTEYGSKVLKRLLEAEGEEAFVEKKGGKWGVWHREERETRHNNPLPQQILVYGLAKGDTERWQEVLLSKACKTKECVEKVKQMASKDGFHSFRVTTFDGGPPDFTKIFRSNPFYTDSDDTGAARELELFVENDADLYRQQEQPIQKNLINKMAKGVYHHAGAVKLYGYLMESGAKKYVKEHGSPGDVWHEMFNTATRKVAAERFADHFETEAALGNFDGLLQKQHQGKWSGKDWKGARQNPGRYTILKHGGTGSEGYSKGYSPVATGADANMVRQYLKQHALDVEHMTVWEPGRQTYPGLDAAAWLSYNEYLRTGKSNPSNPPGNFSSMDELKAANKAIGRHFFEEGKGTVLPHLYGGRFIVTKPSRYSEYYKVWEADADGRIVLLSSHSKKDDAIHVASTYGKNYGDGSRRNNPADESSAMYESFHGTPSTEVVEITDSEHYHSHLASLGICCGVTVQPLNGKGEFAIGLSGYEWDAKDKGFVLVDHGAEKTLLCSDEKGTSLFFEAGDQELDLGKLGIKVEHDLQTVGDCISIWYETSKSFDKFQPTQYYHQFSEDTGGPLPQLLYDVQNSHLLLSGGVYKIEQPLVGTSPGIEN